MSFLLSLSHSVKLAELLNLLNSANVPLYISIIEGDFLIELKSGHSEIFNSTTPTILNYCSKSGDSCGCNMTFLTHVASVGDMHLDKNLKSPYIGGLWSLELMPHYCVDSETLNHHIYITFSHCCLFYPKQLTSEEQHSSLRIVRNSGICLSANSI